MVLANPTNVCAGVSLIYFFICHKKIAVLCFLVQYPCTVHLYICHAVTVVLDRCATLCWNKGIVHPLRNNLVVTKPADQPNNLAEGHPPLQPL